MLLFYLSTYFNIYNQISLYHRWSVMAISYFTMPPLGGIHSFKPLSSVRTCLSLNVIYPIDLSVKYHKKKRKDDGEGVNRRTDGVNTKQKRYQAACNKGRCWIVIWTKRFVSVEQDDVVTGRVVPKVRCFRSVGLRHKIYEASEILL